ncbi:MAG: hypothetical protein LBS83_00540 [Holosporales bacterium]|jgi:hypothetical protein|nr:hypothetical protein [Holosporales bacterium]
MFFKKYILFISLCINIFSLAIEFGQASSSSKLKRTSSELKLPSIEKKDKRNIISVKEYDKIINNMYMTSTIYLQYENIVPKLFELSIKFGLTHIKTKNNLEYYSIDLSWPNIKKYAEKTLGEKEFGILKEFGEKTFADENTERENKTLSWIHNNEELLNKLVDLCISGVFNLSKLLCNDKEKFKILLKELLKTSTGFQRIMSLLTVSILNSTENKIDKKNTLEIRILSNTDSFNREHFNCKENAIVMKTLDASFNNIRTFLHECGHASRYMLLGEYFYRNLDLIRNFSILNSPNIDFTDLFYPMLVPEKMDPIVDRIKDILEKVNLKTKEVENILCNIFLYLIENGFASVVFFDKHKQQFEQCFEDYNKNKKIVAKAIYVYSVASVDTSIYSKDKVGRKTILRNAEEQINMFGITPFNINGTYFIIEDRQNDFIWKIRKSLSEEEQQNLLQRLGFFFSFLQNKTDSLKKIQDEKYRPYEFAKTDLDWHKELIKDVLSKFTELSGVKIQGSSTNGYISEEGTEKTSFGRPKSILFDEKSINREVVKSVCPLFSSMLNSKTNLFHSIYKKDHKNLLIKENNSKTVAENLIPLLNKRSLGEIIQTLINDYRFTCNVVYYKSCSETNNSTFYKNSVSNEKMKQELGDILNVALKTIKESSSNCNGLFSNCNEYASQQEVLNIENLLIMFYKLRPSELYSCKDVLYKITDRFINLCQTYKKYPHLKIFFDLLKKISEAIEGVKEFNLEEKRSLLEKIFLNPLLNQAFFNILFAETKEGESVEDKTEVANWIIAKVKEEGKINKDLETEFFNTIIEIIARMKGTISSPFSIYTEESVNSSVKELFESKSEIPNNPSILKIIEIIEKEIEETKKIINTIEKRIAIKYLELVKESISNFLKLKNYLNPGLIIKKIESDINKSDLGTIPYVVKKIELIKKNIKDVFSTFKKN